MANPGVVASIACSAIFGTAMLWICIYYLHRYIHMRCLQLDHWFHLLTQPSEPKDYGRELGRKIESSPSASDSRPRSARRGRSQGYERERDAREHKSPREREDSVWNGEGRIERPRPVMPLQRPRGEYYPSIEWQGANQMPLGIGMHDSMPMPITSALEPHLASPILPPRDPQLAPHVAPHMAAPPPETVSYVPIGERRYGEPHYEHEPTEGNQAEEPEESQTLHPELVPVRMDFIHICDEYPPIVVEALNQSTPSPASDSSSDSESSVQNIPRAFIPRSVPHNTFPSSLPFQFPQYPHLQTRMYDAGPTSFPRQLLGKSNGRGERAEGRAYARYAPYARSSGPRRKLRNVNVDRRHLAPNFEIRKSLGNERRTRERESRRHTAPERRPKPNNLEERNASERLRTGPGEYHEERRKDVKREKREGGDEQLEKNSVPQEPELALKEHRVLDIERELQPEPISMPEDYAPILEAGEDQQERLIFPERGPILLGTAPPVVEEPPLPAPAEPGEVSPPTKETQVHTICPSSLISTLHESDVVHSQADHGQRHGSRSGSEKVSSRTDGREGDKDEVSLRRSRSAEALCREGDSDIVSTLAYDTEVRRG